MTPMKLMLRMAALLLLFGCGPLSAKEPLRIAVAANFRATLEAISLDYEQRTGQRVLLSSASTGVLHTQILHGAPFDLFFSADDKSPALLLQSGIGAQQFCYATGKLVLAGGTLLQLQDPSFSLAIANPATAPYGRAAEQVIARSEFSKGEQRKLVRGNNVVQAYQYLHTGAVDLALIAATLTSDNSELQTVPIPSDWHLPLRQSALVITSGPAVDAYLKWVRSDTVRARILDAGYLPCS